jgi:hypothetical protein
MRISTYKNKKQGNHGGTEILRQKYLPFLCVFASLWFMYLLVSPVSAETHTSQEDPPRIVTGNQPQIAPGDPSHVAPGDPPQIAPGDPPQIIILDNEIYANNISAINIQGNHVSVEKCKIYQNGNSGIVVDNDANARILNNQIYSQEGAGITVMGKGSSHVSIIGNQIHQNKMTGLQLGAKEQIHVPVHESFKKNPSVIFAQGEDNGKERGEDGGTGGLVGDKGTEGLGDKGTEGLGDKGTGGLGDKGTEGLGDKGIPPRLPVSQSPRLPVSPSPRPPSSKEQWSTITVDVQNNRIHHNGESGIRCQSEYPQHSISLTAEHNAIFQNQKGGIFVANAAKVALRNNTIYENHKAGVSANKSKGPLPQVDIYQNIIRGNEESGLELTGACSGSIGVCNNLIFHNGGSGIRFGASTMRIINNTIVSNGNLSQGSGIDQEEKSIPFIANNILAYNFKTGLNIKNKKGYSYNLFFANGGSGTCCDDCYSSSKFIENKELGGYTRNQGDMICDPAFSNPDIFDFRLKKWSPAIDSGIPSPAFDDLHFPPSQGGRQNDLGATGGPMSVSWDPNALVP